MTLEWTSGGLITLAGSALLASGVWIGHILAARTAGRAAKQSGENALIDQLQEELGRHRDTAERRATAQDERMNRLEVYVDGYRNHAHELRAHIWDGNPPPPPEWPDGLPR